MIGKTAQRPSRAGCARGSPYQADAVELEQVGERQHVDVFVYGVEARDRGRQAARRDPSASAADLPGGRRVGDLKPLGDPQERATQVGELIPVDAGAGSKIRFQLAAGAGRPFTVSRKRWNVPVNSPSPRR